MLDFIKRTFLSKTGKAGLSMILGAAGAWLGDKITGVEAITMIFPAVLAIFVRDRMPKETTRP